MKTSALITYAGFTSFKMLLVPSLFHNNNATLQSASLKRPIIFFTGKSPMLQKRLAYNSSIKKTMLVSLLS